VEREREGVGEGRRNEDESKSGRCKGIEVNKMPLTNSITSIYDIRYIFKKIYYQLDKIYYLKNKKF